MKKNMGALDKVIRILVAVVIAVLFFTKIISGILGIILIALAAIFVLTSLFSFSWYRISIQPQKDLWYIFYYSPFYFKMAIGEIVDAQWFYRLDSSIVGLFIILIVIFIELHKNSKRTIFLTMLTFFIISLFYASFLPIHITNASRLSLGKGLYIFWIGILVISGSIFLED